MKITKIHIDVRNSTKITTLICCTLSPAYTKRYLSLSVPLITPAKTDVMRSVRFVAYVSHSVMITAKVIS